MQKNKETNPTYKLCVVGILCALEIVLSRVAAINVFPWLKISFGFTYSAQRQIFGCL